MNAPVTNQGQTTDLMARARFAALLGSQFGGARDLYDSFGYKKTLTFADHYGRWRRQDIAKRIVSAMPSATWRGHVQVVEDDDPKETDFEAAWSALEQRLGVTHYLERIDTLSGIGRFGVLLMGFGDGESLSSPVQMSAQYDPKKLLYLKPLHEGAVKVRTLVTDTSDSRFGLPETYNVDLGKAEGPRQIDLTSKVVHHSRVLHVAEGLETDEVYGTPRLEVVTNLFEDLAKVVGGGAETFWLSANRGVHLNAREGTNFDPKSDSAALAKEQAQNYVHKLTRLMTTYGMDVNSLGSDIADPRGPFEVAISLLAGATEIPKRILIGSERGELASSQDERAWRDRIDERRGEHAEPRILRAFIQKLIFAGALPEPASGEYRVDWPATYTPTPQERAATAKEIATAARLMANGGDITQVLSVAEFRTLLGLSEKVESKDG